MDFHAAGFLFAHILRRRGDLFRLRRSVACAPTQKEDRNDPVLEKKIERDSTMDDVGVFRIVAQAVDWWEADRAGEAAALPVGAR